MSYKVWQGRFSQGQSELLKRFNASIGFDWVLYRYDIEGSKAWAEALERAGIISGEELSRIKEGLGRILEEIEKGEFQFSLDLEDIHMNIEKRLYELIGEPALKLHTGRSRNDQVALDVRMYVKDRCKEMDGLLKKLMAALVSKAEEVFDIVFPGYTHLQRAQPILLSHHLLAYYEMFKRDRKRFKEAHSSADVMPLGSGALAGTGFPIDREFLAERLGFSRVSRNSMDAVSDRDFILDFLHASSTTMVHLSRLSEELILWSSTEFSIVELPDSFATGSSMMPQKKNPDVPELVRGKASRAFSYYAALSSLLKGLPLAYNKDLQEDKRYLFEVAEELREALDVFSAMIPLLKFKKVGLKGGFLTATDLADYLALKGIPFRKAHGIVGRIVRYAEERGKELWELSLDELRSFCDRIEEDVWDFITVEASLKRRRVIGGTSPERVREEIKRARREVEEG